MEQENESLTLPGWFFRIGVISVICGLVLRLRLRHAMNRAHAPDQRLAIDSHNVAVRENFLHSFECARVVRMAEDWSQNHVICDVEVRIAGRQTIKNTCAGARSGYTSGHRQSDNLK